MTKTIISSLPAKAVNLKLVWSPATTKAADFNKYVSGVKAPLFLPVRFVLTGASTCANSIPERSAHCGWGMILPFWFDKDGFESFNHANAGKSMYTYVQRSCWTAAKKDIKAGSVVTIQFGINEIYHSRS